MMIVKISRKEIREYLDKSPPEFEKYVAPLLNLANFYSQGTRAKNVGQMSELIQEFSGGSIDEWAEWYLQRHPYAIKNATDKISKTIENFKNVITSIDRPTIEKWVKDLVIVKTFWGSNFKKRFLRKVPN